MKEPVLVVMAAGMGSRYGGLKQIDPVGSQGEAILDFSLYDAYRAGFKTAVIIIKKAIEKDFMDTVGRRLKNCPMEIRYAFQELDMLPEGYSIPEGRTKPWGTTHAVLCATKEIDGAPFVVLNSDDYYGTNAFRVAYDALKNNTDSNRCFMIGYEVDKTVSDHGSVTRGICQMDKDGYLADIVECKNVEKYSEGIRIANGDGSYRELPAHTLVSMNMWGLMPSFLNTIDQYFPTFLEEALADSPTTREYLLPTTIAHLIHMDLVRVKVLHTGDTWFGVTYTADKPKVVAALRRLTDSGLYPDGLWK
ncbi:MAG: nucleotidyltransferase [Oscillospiraceae bacterium]|nr:nucleotidyltransferase [Oscillospiraceae bacterium]